ncbi:MAG: prephenate dehydrogenase [Anaerolineaceae bacterium]|nr:prephenate dehydrogenase [Anaerolineaceae bacterium]
MAAVSVAVLGLGREGASVALALKRYNVKKDAKHSFIVTLADSRGGVRDDALKAGIGTKVENNLFNAVQNQDIVVFSLPYADMQSAYRDLGSEMRPGAVILDLSPLKQPSLEWAKQYLPDEVHLVGMTPVLNPTYLFDGLDDTVHARADLFDKGNMLLMPSASCIKEAVELASDFSTLLGSKPHFVDPVEHDGIVALTEGLPSLLGVAAFYAAQRSHGWDDAQRLTNPTFGRLTRSLYDTHPDDLRDSWLNNRDNLLRHLDSLLDTLGEMRDALVRSDRDALEAALIRSSDPTVSGLTAA